MVTTSSMGQLMRSRLISPSTVVRGLPSLMSGSALTSGVARTTAGMVHTCAVLSAAAWAVVSATSWSVVRLAAWLVFSAAMAPELIAALRARVDAALRN